MVGESLTPAFIVDAGPGKVSHLRLLGGLPVG
jgi:hypothetical protein